MVAVLFFTVTYCCMEVQVLLDNHMVLIEFLNVGDAKLGRPFAKFGRKTEQAKGSGLDIMFSVSTLR